MVSCPLCESKSFARDHASARAYVLLGVGFLLLTFSQIILPPFLPLFDLDGHSRVHLLDSVQQVYWLGLLMAGMGGIDLLRDRSMYCRCCGFRLRLSGARTDPVTKRAPMQSSTQCARGQDSGSSVLCSSPMNSRVYRQAIAPLINMLNSKNPNMANDARATLIELSGQDYGHDAVAWSDWYRTTQNSDHV